ncbi:hypothetical protein BH11VER1_BH11VER1_17170 [soil metagenome]
MASTYMDGALLKVGRIFSCHLVLKEARSHCIYIMNNALLSITVYLFDEMALVFHEFSSGHNN